MILCEPTLLGNWIDSLIHFVCYSISTMTVLGGLISFPNLEC